jgi:hypothetical protein
MKAKELAEILLKTPEAEVVVTSSNFEMNREIVAISCVYTTKLKKEKAHFRDAFDGTNYSEDVYVPDEEGIECVKIS